MNILDTDLILYRRRNQTYPPSILLLRVPKDRDRYYRYDLKTHREKQRPIPHMVGLRVNNLDLHDNSNSSFGWQRHSDKIGQISAAPDVLYRNTYLETRQREESEKNNTPRLKLNNSFSCFPSKSSQEKHSNNQYRTIHDRIHQSIRQMEQQRNLSFRIQRPQNEDRTFRRILGEKKSAISRSSSVMTTKSFLFHRDLKSPESFVNYLRLSQPTTPN